MLINGSNSSVQNNTTNKNVNSIKSFSYNIREKPFNTNNICKLKEHFENLIKSQELIKKENTKKTQNNENQKKSQGDIISFEKELLNKNLHFIYSSPDSKKIILIKNHSENKINKTNTMFINMFNLLENETDGSIYKVNDFIIKIPNRNIELSANDDRFTHSTILKNGKRILISASSDYKTN